MEDNIYKTRMTLLAKLRDKHDDAAWADFAYYYRKYIYNIARRMQLDHDAAEEVVQIVMIQSWNKLPEFQYDPKKGRFRGWLCRVTGNAVKNYYRDNVNRFVELDQDFAFSEDLITQPEVERIAEEEWKEYLPKLAWKKVQEHFDDNVKKVWEMSQKGKEVAEIAKTLGIAESSVYVYRKRVQDKLRAEIKQLEFDLG
jgi:RNA polymerase sigma factor (sigma-70 family)